MKLGRVLIACGLLLALALPFLPPFVDRPDLQRWLVQGLILAMFAIAFSISAGLINLVNFGFAAFVGVGGYCSAIIAEVAQISPWISMWIAFGIGGALGAVAGAITMRLRGIYAAMIFWFLGLALQGLVTNLAWLTGGNSGYIAKTLFSTASNVPYYYTALGLLGFGTLLFIGLQRSWIGLAFQAAGDNVDAARASGVNLRAYRTLNVTIACALAALYGAFYAHYYGILTPGFLGTSKTVEIMVPAYVGGRGSALGIIITSLGIVGLTSWLEAKMTDIPGLAMILFSGLLIATLIFLPKGLASIRLRSLSHRWVRKDRLKDTIELRSGT